MTRPRFDLMRNPKFNYIIMSHTGVRVTEAGASVLGDPTKRLPKARDKHRMGAYFRRQLADYVEYHRDPWNCAMHVFGIVFLFLAAVLPLSTLSVAAFGAQTSVATIAVLPVLIYWFLLDAALGAAILGAGILLLSVAAMIVNHSPAASMWSITAVLAVIGVASQIVGPRV